MANRKHGKRHDADYYPTPPWVTRGLLSVWTPSLGYGGVVIECCAATGAIVEVAVHEFGLPVWAFELREGCGEVLRSSGATSTVVGCDWLEVCAAHAEGPLGRPVVHRHALITNPPFSLAFEFAQRSWEAEGLGLQSMALLVRLGFLSSAKRAGWLQANPPAGLIVLSSRPSFTREYLKRHELAGGVWTKHPTKNIAIIDGEELPLGTDSYDYAWVVWERGAVGTWMRWIERDRYLIGRPVNKELQ